MIGQKKLILFVSVVQALDNQYEQHDPAERFEKARCEFYFHDRVNTEIGHSTMQKTARDVFLTRFHAVESNGHTQTTSR
jgi:hypothetical protein